MDSILDSVKSYCGILPDDKSFDTDILMSINAIMVVLNQFGVGPSDVLKWRVPNKRGLTFLATSRLAEFVSM